MSRPVLNIDQITDPYMRKNFEEIRKYFQEQDQLLDFAFFEQVFAQAQSGVKIAHGLGVVPLDILVTYITGTGQVTFKHGQFDSKHIVLDVSGPCRVRFFAGTCGKIISAVQAAASDAQKVSSGV